jgi:Tfp pilus assembly protein PilF
MSLLLDALKKAAEKKAAKSRQEEAAETSSSAETEITAAVENVSEFENPDSTQTRTQNLAPSLSEQMQTGEDETTVLGEEDVSDFPGEPELVRRDQQSSADDTQLDQTEYQVHQAPVDNTEVDQTEYQVHQAPGDNTEVDQTEYQVHQAPGDDTEVDQTEYQVHQAPVDSTEVDQTEYQVHQAPGDNTEVDQTEYQTHHEAGDAERSDDAIEKQHDAIQDEDMSLLLVERDDTNLTQQTSMTDPQAPDYARLAGSGDSGMDELSLAETTRHQIPGDQTEIEAATQADSTTGITPATQATQGATTRTEATSTHTYAPDNYDRTLMKLPNDDASKIFAGMKSEPDVVMTPDYAKKVFRSKSSANRLHSYKVYAGIAVVILLSTAIYGAFQFQNESNIIDSSLQPLKRDPMPGIIKPADTSPDPSLVAESGVRARTIEIIENADDASKIEAVDEGVMSDEGVIADEDVITDTSMATGDFVVDETKAEADDSAAISGSATAAQTESVETTQIASINQSEAAAAQAESNSSTLKIISSNKIRQKDLWLREAYDAYKSGNDSLAMTRYNQVLEVDPGNRNALLARAAINVQNNNVNAAIKDYQTLLLHNPKDSLAMTSLITVANYSPLDTESQLKLMIRDEPNSPYLNFALANAYGAQNRWQEAQGYYFKALENNPGDPNYAYNMAVSLEHIAQPVAAIAYYQRALDNINNGVATFSREVVSQRIETLAKQ